MNVFLFSSSRRLTCGQVLALDIRRPSQREKEREKEWEFGFCLDNLNILWKLQIPKHTSEREGGRGNELENEKGEKRIAVIIGVEYWESLEVKKRKRNNGNE